MEARQPSNTTGVDPKGSIPIPSEQELVLLSLDYLRDLRRAYASPQDLWDAEGLQADWLTLAIYALSRSFTPSKPSNSTPLMDNDAWKPIELPQTAKLQVSRLPSLEQMTQEVVYLQNPNEDAASTDRSTDDPKDDDLEAFAWYDYDDSHASNQHRFYPLNGLGSGTRGPLLLGEVAAAGLQQLQARSRVQAEQEMVASPLFHQFLHTVQDKGFFQDPSNETPCPDPDEDQERLERKEAVYQDRYQKVVAKFRTKLANKADETQTMNLSDVHYTRRLRHCLSARKSRQDGQFAQTWKTATRLAPGKDNQQEMQEAERLKNVGNAHMQQKDYVAAAAAYTDALRLSATGPNSHVYFSNRAAALLSMKQFEQAIADSERSLALKPNYGKAHARLGLAHFLLGDYRQAMEAYTVALKYEPDNKSSKSYLEKAAKRLAKQEESAGIPGSSFSVVSEWDKHQSQQVKPPTTTPAVSPAVSAEQRQAEAAKVQGNQFMAHRQYVDARQAYTEAIQLCPDGPQSHVYFANRAAALCYLEDYEQAAADSLASLRLQPNYGKAHARLGLSRYFLKDYTGAIQAYTAALKYDPDNAASKSYLAKAKLKWEKESTPSPRHQIDEDARRLMNDPDMHTMAKKVMATSPTSGSVLLEDPEMLNIAKKALHDPAMMSAVKAVVNK